MEDSVKNVDLSEYNIVMRVIIFILVANVIGTNVFIPQYFTLQFALEIWTWSLFASLVFIITMSSSLMITLKLHSNNGKIFSNGLICGGMVYLGYMISWFFVCNLSDDFDMEYYPFVFHGYWGALACMFTSMIMMSNTSQKYNLGRNKFECPCCYFVQMIPENFHAVAKCVECKTKLFIHSSEGDVVATVKGIE